MDTFQMFVAFTIFAVTLLLMILSYFYIDRTQRSVQEDDRHTSSKKTQETSDSEPVSEKSCDGNDESEAKDGCLPPEAMKCPFSYFEHIPGEMKKTEHEKIQKKIEEGMSAEDKEREREVQRRQMEEIFKLMQEQEETFGISDINQVQEQLRMYSPNM